MRSATLCLLMLLLAGCSARNWYDGLQQDAARRQAQPGGEQPLSKPPVDYHDYEAERQRLKKDQP
ncbi:MAG: hypothetical protein HGA47_00815 [Zoogloea sp.]|nr:hypothetical protein [Zoogloea sp.]